MPLQILNIVYQRDFGYTLYSFYGCFDHLPVILYKLNLYHPLEFPFIVSMALS